MIFLGSCGEWKCEVCGNRKAWRFVGIARSGCALATERIRVLTLTAPREDPAVSWEFLGPRWHRLRERLARRLGRRLSYFATRVRMSQDWYEKPKQPACVWGEGWVWQIWDSVEPDFVERRLFGDGVLSVHRMDVEVSTDE